MADGEAIVLMVSSIHGIVLKLPVGDNRTIISLCC